MYSIHLAKETFKFSCSHFTILAADRAERLHGHNYQVRADIAVDQLDPQLGFAFDFNAVKPLIRDLCNELDERILIPQRSPYLKITASGAGTAESLEILFSSKRYVFPKEDTFVLPLINLTSEELARHLGSRLKDAMNKAQIAHWTALDFHVEETRGQSVSCHFQR